METLKYWNQNTFEISSYKWHLEDRKNKSYKTSGSDNSEKCQYTYNELGFRGDSIYKDGFKIMSIGCSHTEGVGVNDNETWSHQLCNLIPNSVDLNFGCGGRSNDYISRCLLSYYDLIKPDLVLIMYTYPHRKEFYTKDGGVEPFIPGLEWGYMQETDMGKIVQQNLSQIQNDNEDFINWYKNHMLISLFLESKNCKWSWNGSFVKTEYTDKKRFDGEYNTFIDLSIDGAHPGPEHNLHYANRLYEYLNHNLLITNTL